jgi:N-acetylmuramoyl-L-alanine amidase
MRMDFSSISSYEIVALTIYGEGRGEPIEGQIAIGCIIRNRVHEATISKGYKDICLAPLQFSCWNENDPNRKLLESIVTKMQGGFLSTDNTTDPVLRQCIYVSKGIVDWDIMSNIGSSTNYMTKQLYNANPPVWARELKVSSTIGKHVFLV